MPEPKYSEEKARSELRYETQDNEYSTYIMCPCGRRGYRGIQCAECWREYLKKHYPKS
jgi:hypothetical protein